MPKFSVVVPVYKVEQYLKRCLDSLVGQTLEDIEIILVDDGSPDNCPAICDEYAGRDARIRVIHKKNGGVSAARNDGLDLATGEYIIFCDSDDWMELDALETLYMTAKEKNADIVIADINRITDKGAQRRYLFSEEFSYTEISQIQNLLISILYPQCCDDARSTGGYGGPWNKAIRREILSQNNIRFNVSVGGVCDDRLVNAAAYMAANKVVYIQKAVYNYVLVENSITQSYKQNIREINMEIFKAFSQLLPLVSEGGRCKTHTIPSLYGGWKKPLSCTSLTRRIQMA